MPSEILEVLGHEQTSLFFAVGILVLGLTAAVTLGLRAASHVRHVRAAADAIETAPDGPDFARRFDTISQEIESSRALRSAWLDFKSTLLVAKDDDADEATVKTTTNLTDHFSAARLREGWRDERLVPGLLLGVALLLTVVATYSAMTRALDTVAVEQTARVGDQSRSSQVRTDNGAAPKTAPAPAAALDARQHTLRRFLAASKAGFTVAGTGLLVSVLLTILLQTGTARLNAALQRLVAVLQQRVVRITFEAAVLGRLKAIQNATTGIDSSANAAISENLKLTLTQTLPDHFDHATQSLHKAIEDLSARSGDADQASSRRLTEDLAKLISDRVSGPMRSTNEQVQEQLFAVRESLLNISSLITESRLNGAAHDAPDSVVANAQVANASLDEGVDTEDAAASDPSEMRQIGHDLAARIETDVADPLRTLHAAIDDLRVNLDPVHKSDSDFPNDQLISEIVERLEARIAKPMDAMTSALGAVRSDLETVAHTAEQWSAPTPGSSEENAGVNEATLAALLDDRNQQLLEQNQAAINLLSNRIEEQIIAPLQDLTTAAPGDGQASSDHHVQAAAHAISTTSAELLQAVRTAADNLRGDVKELSEHAVGEETSQALADKLQHCCAQLDEVAEQLAENGSAIETRLEELGEPLPDEVAVPNAAAPSIERLAEQLEAKIAAPIDELRASMAGMHQILSYAQARASRPGATAPSSNTATAQRGLGANNAQATIDTLTKQAQDAWESARVNLIGQLAQSERAVEETARHWHQNPSDVTTQIKQLIEAAPTDWAREAEHVAEAAERTVRLVVHDMRRLIEHSPGHKELTQATAALTQINERLTSQTTEDRNYIRSEIATTMNVVERSSASIFASIADAGPNLAPEAKAVADDVLRLLVKASTELRALTKQSSDVTAPSLSRILRAATRARRAILPHLEQRRHRLGQASTVPESSLKETIIEMANTMASLSRNLSATTDSVLASLQSVSNEVRLREGQFAMEKPSGLEAEFAALKARSENGRIDPAHS